ncbi:ABC transporter ATP-binding protein [Roseibium sp. SCPC15]|uniref:ABC transporter ATP-binding protein n=1 Tax=Roseibium sp. SCP15 TaxID=3141376 RepID=UPI003334D2BF
MKDTLIDIKDLTVSFTEDKARLVALDQLSLTIPEGKTLCLVGESGCGKSLTAKTILRVQGENARIENGSIDFRSDKGGRTDLAGLDPKGKAIRAIRGDQISMIYQEPLTALSPLYTIGNQITEALRWHRKLSEKEARAEALYMLERVGMPAPEKRFHSYSFELSGGQRQRAMIAMALVCRPRLLIADEPTTALDVTTQAVILDLLKELQKEERMSMLLITHDLGVVADIGDEVAVMYMGEVVESGPVDEILRNPKHPYTRGLIASLPTLGGEEGQQLQSIPGSVPHLRNRVAGCSFASRCGLAVSEVCQVQNPSLMQIETDHSVRCHALQETNWPRKAAKAEVRETGTSKPDYCAPPILKVSGLSKHFLMSRGFFSRQKELRPLRRVSFDLWPGETLGLVGESGCGKSTLGQTILGLLRPTEGQIELQVDNGYVNLADMPEKQLKSYWRDLRMVFQDPNGSFNPRMTVFDIIAEVLRTSEGKIAKPTISERVEKVMEMVGLSRDFLDRYPHAFSGGQRQRIGIARALAPMPRIIVADEPVSALDVSVQAQVLNLLKELQGELGLTYLFISHDLSVVSHISDRVAVMYAGEIVEIAQTRDIFSAPKHPYTQALLSSVLEPVPRSERKRQPIRLGGAVPDPGNLPNGCKFRDRCAFAQARCASEAPTLNTNGLERVVACFYPLNTSEGQNGQGAHAWQA